MLRKLENKRMHKTGSETTILQDLKSGKFKNIRNTDVQIPKAPQMLRANPGRAISCFQKVFKCVKSKIKMIKGKSKEATKEQEKPVWLKFSEKDIEAIILKLAKQGLTSEKIGLVLRDTYGIPKAKIYGKKISQVLKENKLSQDTNLVNLEKKQQVIKSHIEKNKKDKKAKRALTIITARIFEHKKYKKRENVKPD